MATYIHIYKDNAATVLGKISAHTFTFTRALYPHMSMFALLGGEVRVRGWIREQRKIKENHKGTTKPLMVNLDSAPLHVCM